MCLVSLILEHNRSFAKTVRFAREQSLSSVVEAVAIFVSPFVVEFFFKFCQNFVVFCPCPPGVALG